MKKFIVRMFFLDNVGATIKSDYFDVVHNNHPLQVLGTGRLFRNEKHELLTELTFNEELYFYFLSDNTRPNGYWFQGGNLGGLVHLVSLIVGQ